MSGRDGAWSLEFWGQNIFNRDYRQIVAGAPIPDLRAPLGIRVMQAGKDYLSDKPGITSLEQLAAVRKAVKETKRKFAIMYSERLEVRSAVHAGDLIKQGAIGRVVQTVNLAPHRVNAPSRPDWFFDKAPYGGILTDYTIATTPRFKAAISGAGSALQTSMYGVDQYILQYETELGAPWKNPDAWMKVSYAFFHADRIKTPTLFMSGEKDFNVPTAGSEQMYQALKSLGIDTQLVIYPNSFHGITMPSYRVDRLERYLKWYDRYLKPVAQ